MIGERTWENVPLTLFFAATSSVATVLDHFRMPSVCPSMPYELGTARRNYVYLEALIPALNSDHMTEDYVIEFLLRDTDGDSVIRTVVKFLEEHRTPGQPCVWLRHKGLLVPLLYEIGEGEACFRDRLIRRRWAGECLGLVSSFAGIVGQKSLTAHD